MTLIPTADSACYLEVNEVTSNVTSFRISRGILDSSNRDSLFTPTLANPGQEYEFKFDIQPTDYIVTTMPASDSATWFGKTPPDLSLMARARGTDYLYQFLKTFYVDSTKTSGANNLRLDSTAGSITNTGLPPPAVTR